MDEAAFDAAMMGIYTTAKRELNYNASRFFQMLIDNRGLDTARTLIYAAQPSDGYTDLYDLRRLDLTVEALVLQSRWQTLFADEPELLERARRRLTDYRFPVETIQ